MLLGRGVLHADETPVAMLVPGDGKTRKAYIWSYSTSPYDPKRAVIYDFADGRVGHHARAFLGNWKGNLVCDDYAGYKALFAKLYGVEREIGECSDEQRRRIRQLKAKPMADALHEWLVLHRQKVPDGTAIAEAIGCSLKRWTALTRPDGYLRVTKCEL